MNSKCQCVVRDKLKYNISLLTVKRPRLNLSVIIDMGMLSLDIEVYLCLVSG